MKRAFFALAFLTTVGMVSFNRAEMPSQENSSEEIAWMTPVKPVSFTTSIKNEGTGAVSPFVIVRYIHADGSHYEVKAQGESLLPGQKGTIFVNVEPSAENPVISVNITAIGCEAFSQNLNLSEYEAQQSSFVIRDTEVTLTYSSNFFLESSVQESQETGN